MVKAVTIFVFLVFGIFFILYSHQFVSFIINVLPSVFMTGRGGIWSSALTLTDSYFVGVGFDSFWHIGGESKMSFYADSPSLMWLLLIEQAHNGYLDTFLATGIIGLFFLLFLMYKTLRLSLVCVSQGKMFPFAIWMMIMITNFSETSFFYYFSPLWFVFLLYTIPNYEMKDQNISNV